ncbi:response regulator [Sphingobacterium sp. DR205]|uniref:hybrid sensor histidine kinase/response regulator transcription factor n=1 Tax=Sphingobacterium sp. DR205 TaxID=2713573 RepID=UPI0013E51BB1|nr:response regulator [Sphingobacterium sp. DR205]QIH35634.1 response regulator [Sphingobacterium sp. DR205]
MSAGITQIIAFLYLYLSLTTVVYSQHIGLNPLTKNYDLPSLTINQTIQDQEGYIWFASTQGLSRYDAYNILNFKLRNAAGKVTTQQSIRALIALGNKLILGSESGVYVLDKRNYKVFPLKDSRVATVRVNALMVDLERRLWIGTDNGIFIYNSDLIPLTEAQSSQVLNSSMQGKTVNMIFQDSQANIWIGVWGAGLFKLNPSSSKLTSYPRLGQRNNPFKLMEDDRGQLWLCTWGDGIYLFNPQQPNNPYKEIEIKNKRRTIGKEDLFYNIIQDQSRRYIWVLSFSGISTLQYQDGRVKEIDLSGYFDSTTNIFNDIYQDRYGTLWLAIGGKGVAMLSFDKPNLKNCSFKQIKKKYSITPNLNMLYRDSSGVIWFNLERFGFGSLSTKTNQLNTYSNSNFRDLISIRAVTCATDFGQELWVGSAYESSINIFQKTSNNIKLLRKINLEQQVAHQGVPSFFFTDKQKRLWIATTQGLLLKKSASESITTIHAVNDQPVAIAQDNYNHIWVATKENGIYCIDDRSLRSLPLHIGKETRGLKSDQIETMDVDNDGILWIGTKDNRLLSYQPAHNKVREIANTTLFEKNQLLDVVCLDRHIWLSTTRNIYKINRLNKNISEFSASDSLQVNMFSKRAFAVDKNTNTIYFGGYNGMVQLNDHSIIPNFKENVLITDIKINNKSIILESKQKIFSDDHSKLTLNPQDQNIEISFSTLPFTQEGKIRYAYKLEGVDKDWIYAPRDRIFATYNNLSKGKYRFLVRSTDLYNKWNTSFTQIEIIKKPSFYESNLAYFIYACIFGGIVFFFINYSFNRLKLSNDLKIAQIEKEKTKELAQSKLSYFTNISHDLLTPLTIISCLVDDVQMTTKNNLDQFDKIRLNLSRLKRLLQQILDFRRMETSSMKLQISASNFPTFINQLGAMHFSPIAKKKNISFEIQHGDCPEILFYDVDKIDKILFNLLSNAFKYTDHGGQITLTYHVEKEKGSSRLLIYIRDNGIGIDPENITKIFTAFYNNNSTKHPESNGIGLSVTKQLVEAHDGEIRVDSQLHIGSMFQISIPVDKSYYLSKGIGVMEQPFVEEIKDTIIESHERSNNLSNDILQPRLNVLLVEDNEELRSTMARILARNYQVHIAHNGLQGLEALENNEIDIVISDIMMPELDGLNFCRTIKSNTEFNHIPVLLLTAKSSIEDRIECYQAGADGYISKPFEIKVLEAKIQSFIINKRCKQLVFHSNTKINIATLDHTPLDEKFVQKMIQVIEEHLSDDQFDVIKLGDILSLSKSTLYRKTKVLLNVSPSEFIKNIRLKHACQIMEIDKSISVSEVAFATGFSDPRYFATCFKAAFGITPSEFQKKSGSNSFVSL